MIWESVPLESLAVHNLDALDALVERARAGDTRALDRLQLSAWGHAVLDGQRELRSRRARVRGGQAKAEKSRQRNAEHWPIFAEAVRLMQLEGRKITERSLESRAFREAKRLGYSEREREAVFTRSRARAYLEAHPPD
jgi:hypothetical protein